MKFHGLKLATVSALSLAAIYYSVLHAGQGGMDVIVNKANYKAGAADPAVQNIVDQFQTWALAKRVNPNTPNDLIVIPTANTNKEILGNGTRLTQEIMDKAASDAARDFGHELPMERIMSAKIKMRIGDFMQKSDEFILKYIAHNNPEKQKVWIEAREALRAKAAKKDFVKAKVLGPAEMVNMQREGHSASYCRPISCDIPRMKVPVRLFADIIEKLESSGVLDEKDLAEIKQATTFNYYFVQKPNGQWAFQEVAVGVGWMLTKTSF